MTRKQRIQAAKAFTEKEGGLEALADNYKMHLEEGCLEASLSELINKKIERRFIDGSEPHKKRIWAFNSQGIATTEF